MNTPITARLRSLKICAACAFVLCALGFTQHQDEADDQAARVHVQQAGK